MISQILLATSLFFGIFSIICKWRKYSTLRIKNPFEISELISILSILFWNILELISNYSTCLVGRQEFCLFSLLNLQGICLLALSIKKKWNNLLTLGLIIVQSLALFVEGTLEISLRRVEILGFLLGICVMLYKAKTEGKAKIFKYLQCVWFLLTSILFYCLLPTAYLEFTITHYDIVILLPIFLICDMKSGRISSDTASVI
ncbi:unnamed protein product [Blepharisma stoltei]|uniref:Uncharacterized protein n=1 Tax=Blepharisma stoltei TaxID=1481888 RepID=A0AAU9K550_9CILI|nr:unnamed protein product [Blepharisma stoltei]